MAEINTLKLSLAELAQLNVSIELNIASVKRAMNTSKKPDFKVLYEKDLRELTALQNKIKDAEYSTK